MALACRDLLLYHPDHRISVTGNTEVAESTYNDTVNTEVTESTFGLKGQTAEKF